MSTEAQGRKRKMQLLAAELRPRALGPGDRQDQGGVPQARRPQPRGAPAFCVPSGAWFHQLGRARLDLKQTLPHNYEDDVS